MRFDNLKTKHGAGRRARMMRGRGHGGSFGGGFGGPRGGGFAAFGDDGREGRAEGRGMGRGRHGGGLRGGGRGRRMFAGGELRLLLLSLLGEGERHGYELIKAIEDLTGGQYAPSPGVVYPTLSLLLDEAMIAEAAGEGARKAFAATEAGREEIARRQAEVEAITARLKALAEDGAREASPPVIRAMANLKMALRGRLSTADFTTETAHAIADVLDEAARRIERL